MNKCSVCGAKCEKGDKCFRHKRSELKSNSSLKKGKGLKTRKKTEEQLALQQQEIDRMKLFAFEIWNEREHYCVSCDKWLGKELKSYMIEHCLEKSKYPELKYNKDNIQLICLECHSMKTNGFPLPKYAKIIEETKERFGII